MTTNKINNANVVLKHDLMFEVTKKFESIDEHRFLNSCLQGNYQRELFNEAKYYPIDVRNYASKQNVSISKAYEELIELVTKYKETTVKIPLDDNRTWHTSLIYDFIVDRSLYTIQVQFNKKIIPLISGEMEAGKFSIYNSKLDTISSNKRYMMCELLQRNMWKIQKFGYFILTISEIREAINLQEHQYKEFKALNRSIIQASIKDLADNLGIRLKATGNKVKVRFEPDVYGGLGEDNG